jgi:antagonist of KipI
MGLQFIKSGFITSIQDLGRYGFQHLGINPGGAMDLVAMQLANALVMNQLGEAVVEFGFPAPEIKFLQAGFIALSGADFDAHINDKPVPINQPIFVPTNAILSFKKKKNKAFGYLAVQAGFLLDDWLNSYSTNTKVQAGGLAGRLIRSGDFVAFNIPLNKSFANESITLLPWKADANLFYLPQPIELIEGKEFVLVSPATKTLFLSTSYTISTQSDRMGYRLNGSLLNTLPHEELISTGVTRGTIQLIPNGQMIVLMADHQTTGGYPRIGHICNSSLCNFAQLNFGEAIYFKTISLAEAEEKEMVMQRNLLQIKNACTLQLDEYHRH